MSLLKLSVLMPNFNHAQYVAEALDAIVNQSFKPFEVIVCDDNSTDNSVDIIQQLVDRYQFVRLIRNNANVGVNSSCNKLIALASGDCLFFAAADDRVLPGLFEKSMRMLELYPQAGLCCSDAVNFNNQQGFDHIKHSRMGIEACYLSAGEVVKVMRGGRSSIAPVTCLIRRSCLMKAGGYIPELKWNGDWFLNSVIAFRCGICYIPEPLGCQRILRSSYSFVGGHNWRWRIRLAVDLANLLNLPEHDDVRDSFRKSCNMAYFGIPMLYALFRCRKNWKYLSLLAIPYFIWNEVRLFFGLKTPNVLKMAYYHLGRTIYNEKRGVR